MDYPTTFEGTLIFSEGVGAIAGILIGIQDVAIQRWLEDRWSGWLSALRVIVFYALAWTIIMGLFPLLSVYSETPDALAEVSRSALTFAIGFGLTFPTCNYLLKRLDSNI